MPNEKLVSTVVYLDSGVAAWLDAKSLEGCKKSALIRRALHIYMDSELAADEYRKGQSDAPGGA